jgi:hypothetical protein
MEEIKLSQILAARRLCYVEDGLEICTVEILIGMPVKFQNSDDFYVPYKISGPKADKLSYAGGVDEIQALSLALQKIGVELSALQKKLSGQLTWLGLADLGFPNS